MKFKPVSEIKTLQDKHDKCYLILHVRFKKTFSPDQKTKTTKKGHRNPKADACDQQKILFT